MSQLPHPETIQPTVRELIERRLAAGSRPGSRDDRYRLALVVEGGANRGTITGGMGLELAERGVLPAVDDLYGASSGAITAAWLASPHPERLHGWQDPTYTRMLIRPHNLLRRRPLIDLRTLTDVVYTRLSPMDFAGVLVSPATWHPVATDVESGEAVDLRPMLSEPADVQTALRASCGIPVLSGAPVGLAGRRYVDAGVAEPIPFRTALRQGATHLLVLRSRRADDVPRHSAMAPVLAHAMRRRYPPAYQQALLTSTARYQQDERDLAELARTPVVWALRPGPSAPDVARFATDAAVLVAGFEAGRAAVRDGFSTNSTASANSDTNASPTMRSVRH